MTYLKLFFFPSAAVKGGKCIFRYFGNFFRYQTVRKPYLGEIELVPNCPKKSLIALHNQRLLILTVRSHNLRH